MTLKHCSANAFLLFINSFLAQTLQINNKMSYIADTLLLQENKREMVLHIQNIKLYIRQ